MANASCSSDQDCAAPFVCYEASECACDNWYGWSGDDCSELNGHAYLLIISAGVQAVIGLVGIFACLRGFVLAKIRGKLTLNAAVVTLLYVSFAFVFLVLWRAISLYLTLTPEKNTELEDNNFNFVRTHEHLHLEKIAVVFASSLVSLALLNISLMWIQTAKLSKALTAQAQKRMTMFSRFIIGFEVLWTLVQAILALLGQQVLVIFASLPFLLLIVICYSVGRYKMVSLLVDVRSTHSGDDSSKERARSYNLIIQRIRNTTRAVIFSLSISLVGAFLYAIPIISHPNNREWSDREATFQTTAIGVELIPLGMLMSMLTLASYVLITLIPAKQNRSETGLSPMSNQESSKVETLDQSVVATNYKFSI